MGNTVRKFSIKELRVRKGWTQAETAEILGVSTQTYNAWENNIENLTISKIKILANIFDVDFNEIFLG